MLNPTDHDLLIELIARMDERSKVVEQVRAELVTRNIMLDQHFARLERKIDSIASHNGKANIVSSGGAGVAAGGVVAALIALARALGWV